jgi:hypothetical protein
MPPVPDVHGRDRTICGRLRWYARGAGLDGATAQEQPSDRAAAPVFIAARPPGTQDQTNMRPISLVPTGTTP